MLIAGGLGLAVGRIARSLKDAGDDDEGGSAPSSGGGATGSPAQGGYPAPSAGTTTGYPASSGTAGTGDYTPPPSYPPAPGGGL